MKKVYTLVGVLLLFIILTVNVKALNVTEDLVLDNDLSERLIVNGKNVTIDLNGHSITAAENGVLYITNGGSVTLVGEGTIESTSDNGVIVSNGSTFTMQSGTIKSVEFGVLVTNNSTFTMNNGTITTSDNCGAGGNGTNSSDYKNYTININGGTINGNIKSSGYVSCGIYHPNKGTVNITGGVINSSNGAGVVQRAGTLNISGGVINASGSTVGKVGDSRVVVSASAVVIDKLAAYPEVSTLSTTISKNAKLFGSANDIETLGENVNIQLIGGVYNEEPANEQIPDGYSAYQVLEGDNKDKYIVVKEDELENVAAPKEVNNSEIAASEANLIEETLNNNHYDLVSIYDISASAVTETGDVVNYVTETPKEVTVSLRLPTALAPVASGYTRKFYIIRIHNGIVTIINDVTVNDDGTISFKSNQFSTYAVAYIDSQNSSGTSVSSTSNQASTSATNSNYRTSVARVNTLTNPQTGDNIFANIAMLAFCLTSLAGGIIYFKKAVLKK